MGLFGILGRLVLAAILYLPLRWMLGPERWWMAALIALAASTFVVFMVKGFTKALFLLPFRMKGETLKGATLTLHDVQRMPTPAPELDEDGEPDEPAEDRASRSWYSVDATITPQEKPTERALPMWEPGELQLVLPATNMSPWVKEPMDDDACIVRHLEIHDEGEWRKDEGEKYAGARRLRFLAGVTPGVAQLRVRYYFESIGLVDLPS